MIDYTTDALLEYTRTVCMTPAADALFTDSRLLPLINGEQMGTLLPQLLSVREDYFLHSEDFTLVSGQLDYQVPERAVGSKIADIALIDSAGNECYIQRMNLSDKKLLGPIGGPVGDWSTSFFFKDDYVTLFPSVPTQYVSLRMYFYRRPSNLVLPADAGLITAIDTGTSTVTVDSLPGDWVQDDTVDIIQRRPTFPSLADDVTITGISGADVTLSELPDDLAVGDWLSLSGTTPIPQFPYEIHPFLGQLGAAKALESMADAEGLKLALTRVKQMREDLFKLITPRADNPALKIISPNNVFNRGAFGPAWRMWR